MSAKGSLPFTSSERSDGKQNFTCVFYPRGSDWSVISFKPFLTYNQRKWFGEMNWKLAASNQ